jgi:hypothetical protein
MANWKDNKVVGIVCLVVGIIGVGLIIKGFLGYQASQPRVTPEIEKINTQVDQMMKGGQ